VRRSLDMLNYYYDVIANIRFSLKLSRILAVYLALKTTSREVYNSPPMS